MSGITIKKLDRAETVKILSNRNYRNTKYRQVREAIQSLEAGEAISVGGISSNYLYVLVSKENKRSGKRFSVKNGNGNSFYVIRVS